MYGRFIALRPLLTKSGRVKAGDPIPEAHHWPVGVVLGEISAGNVKDLHNVLKPSETHQVRRQDALVHEMRAKGRFVVAMDGSGFEPGVLGFALYQRLGKRPRIDVCLDVGRGLVSGHLAARATGPRFEAKQAAKPRRKAAATQKGLLGSALANRLAKPPKKSRAK